MSVFFTDSDCELWYTDVDKYNIKVLNMPYTLDGEEKFYDMGRNTDLKHLFDRMRAGAMPITSALNPQDYMDAFEPIFARGEDILYVHFSDKLSGTFNYMTNALNILKEKYPERKVTLFNTNSICYGGGIQALMAAKMHSEGKSDEEIVKRLEEVSPHIVMEFVVDSLSHLKRGGRVSAATAIVGGLLNIKPILKMTEDGKIEKFATAKGMKKAILTIVESCVQRASKTDEFVITIIDADNKDMADYAEKLLKEKLSGVEINRLPIGPVIGAHCGPGAVGIVYYGDKR